MKKQCIRGLVAAGIYMILSVCAAVTAAEPNTVGSIFKEKGFEWFTGKWQTAPDANEQLLANFSFEMDGYVLSLDVKVGERYLYRGIVFYSPGKAVLVNSGIDTRGFAYSGTWSMDGDKLALNGEVITADGKDYRFVRYYSKVNQDSMKVVTYRIIEGKLSEEPADIRELKRAKN